MEIALSRGAMERDPVIAAGFGFRAAAGRDSLRAALELACGGLVPTVLATAEGKQDNQGLRDLATQMHLQIRAVPEGVMSRQKTHTTSAASKAAYGTPSVAEAAALAAAGPNARLITPRQISPDRMATCAIAQGDDT
ncbi:MAG: cobalamin biosynthesis protein [Sulfitobacter sp.]